MGTNKLDGQNLTTFVGPFQRLFITNGEGPEESQDKNNRKQTGDYNALLEARCDIKVSEARDYMPAFSISTCH